jgi:ubiquinone/menaquinone biosynthesis C-methylase UbiE
MKIDIACGPDKQPGFKGVDSVARPGVDIVVDLTQFPWAPFKDNSVDEVYCGQYCERAPDLVRFMDELWRICRNGATVRIVSAYYSSLKASQNPLNVRGISEATFQYFDKEWRKANKIEHYPIHCNFKPEKMLTFINQPWNAKSDETKQFAQRHYLNIVSDVLVELRAVK